MWVFEWFCHSFVWVLFLLLGGIGLSLIHFFGKPQIFCTCRKNKFVGKNCKTCGLPHNYNAIIRGLNSPR